MSDRPTLSRTRIGAVAGAAGAGAVLALVMGVGPAPSVFQLAGAGEDTSGPCDEAEHASDLECQRGSPATSDDGSASSTVDETTSTTVAGGGPAMPADEVRSLDAAGAGTVIYAVEGGSFRLISATPAAGWRVDVEQSAGREIDLDFRSGSKRVQVDIELEDGQVRERVRFRDDADDTDLRTEDGVVEDDRSGPSHGDDDDVDDVEDDDDDDDSGHGSDDDGSGHDDDDDDRSGSDRGSG